MNSIVLVFIAALCSAPATYAAQDGAARQPPRGWRDWNQWQGTINQAIMTRTMDAMVNTSRGGVSLASLGYSDVGLDDAWQLCGKYGPKVR